MRYRWDVTAYGRGVFDGELSPRAGASTRTRLGAWWWAWRYWSGYPSGVSRYEDVRISPHVPSK